MPSSMRKSRATGRRFAGRRKAVTSSARMTTFATKGHRTRARGSKRARRTSKPAGPRLNARANAMSLAMQPVQVRNEVYGVSSISGHTSAGYDVNVAAGTALPLSKTGKLAWARVTTVNADTFETIFGETRSLANGNQLLFEKIFFLGATVQVQMSNSSGTRIDGCVYRVRPRRDIEQGPVETMIRGLATVPGPATSVAKYDDICDYGFTPYKSPMFTAKYKIVKQWGIRLNPGETRSYTFKSKAGFLSRNRYLTAQSTSESPVIQNKFLSDWTDEYLFCFWGTPVHLINAASGTPPAGMTFAGTETAPVQVDYVIDRRLEWKNVYNNVPVVDFNGGFGSGIIAPLGPLYGGNSTIVAGTTNNIVNTNAIGQQVLTHAA